MLRTAQVIDEENGDVDDAPQQSTRNKHPRASTSPNKASKAGHGQSGDEAAITAEDQVVSWNEAKKIVRRYMQLSGPAILAFFLLQAQDQISMYFIASMDSTTELAGIGLGNMMIILIPYSVMIGINTALETLVARAAGRGNMRDCGLYLHRSILIITLVFIPVSCFLYFTQQILESIGIEEEVASFAASYVRQMLPGVLLNSYSDAIDLFLVPMGYSSTICLLQTLMLPIHFAGCYVFVTIYEWGVIGAACAQNITAVLMLILVCAFVSLQPSIKDAWYLPTMETFNNTYDFLRLAVPGMLMLLLENSNLQILLLLAGLTNSEEMIAAQSLVVSIGDLLIIIPYGLALGIVTQVGQHLGQNDPVKAKRAYEIASIFSTFLGFCTCSILYFCREYIISTYTDNEEISEMAVRAFTSLCGAVFCTWTAGQLSGTIKAVGAQGIASVGSLLCILCVELPLSYYFGVEWFTLWGLWLGYAVSGTVLAGLYIYILTVKIDWRSVALKASENECDQTKVE